MRVEGGISDVGEGLAKRVRRFEQPRSPPLDVRDASYVLGAGAVGKQHPQINTYQATAVCAPTGRESIEPPRATQPTRVSGHRTLVHPSFSFSRLHAALILYRRKLDREREGSGR